MTKKKEDKEPIRLEGAGLVSFHFEGYELVEKLVKQSGNSGRIYLPASWIGKRVKIIRMEPISKEEM